MSQESVNWLASLRARLGYTLNNGVLYATGGLGFEGIQDKYLLSTDAADSSVYSTSTVSSANRVVVGWVAGAGVENDRRNGNARAHLQAARKRDPAGQ